MAETVAQAIVEGLNEMDSEINAELENSININQLTNTQLNVVRAIKRLRKLSNDIVKNSINPSKYERQGDWAKNMYGDFLKDINSDVRQILEHQWEVAVYEFQDAWLRFYQSVDQNVKPIKLVYVYHDENYGGVQVYDEVFNNDDSKSSILAQRAQIANILTLGASFKENFYKDSNLMKARDQDKNSKTANITTAYQETGSRAHIVRGSKLLILWLEGGSWAKAFVASHGDLAEAYVSFLEATDIMLQGLFEGSNLELWVGDFVTGSPNRGTLFAQTDFHSNTSIDALNNELLKQSQGMGALAVDNASGFMQGDVNNLAVKSIGASGMGYSEIVYFARNLDQALAKMEYNFTQALDVKKIKSKIQKFMAQGKTRNKIVGDIGGQLGESTIQSLLDKQGFTMEELRLILNL